MATDASVRRLAGRSVPQSPPNGCRTGVQRRMAPRSGILDVVFVPDSWCCFHLGGCGRSFDRLVETRPPLGHGTRDNPSTKTFALHHRISEFDETDPPRKILEPANMWKPPRLSPIDLTVLGLSCKLHSCNSGLHPNVWILRLDRHPDLAELRIMWHCVLKRSTKGSFMRQAKTNPLG